MCAELKTNSQKRNQKIEMECKKIKKTMEGSMRNLSDR